MTGVKPVFKRTHELKKSSNEFRNALVVYFAFHRTHDFGSYSSFFNLIVFAILVCVAMARWLVPVFVPMMISSVLIKIELLVDQMQIR
jgi:heme exporter protein D